MNACVCNANQVPGECMCSYHVTRLSYNKAREDESIVVMFVVCATGITTHYNRSSS